MPRWVVAFTAIVLFLMHLPVLVLVAFSFNASKFSVSWTGFTMHWYQRLLEREDILAALRASLLSLHLGQELVRVRTHLGHQVSLRLLGPSSATFSSRTFTRGAPNTPKPLPRACAAIRLLTYSSARLRARATRGA